MAAGHEYHHMGNYQISAEIYTTDLSHPQGIGFSQAIVGSPQIVGNLLEAPLGQPIQGVLGAFDPNPALLPLQGGGSYFSHTPSLARSFCRRAWTGAMGTLQTARLGSPWMGTIR